MPMKLHKWEDVKRRRFSEKQIAQIREDVAREVLELDLKAMRETLGKTQDEIAKKMKMAQSEVSRLERRGDHRLSTLRRLVKALGGELEVIANFGKKRIRLHGAG